MRCFWLTAVVLATIPSLAAAQTRITGPTLANPARGAALLPPAAGYQYNPYPYPTLGAAQSRAYPPQPSQFGYGPQGAWNALSRRNGYDPVYIVPAQPTLYIGGYGYQYYPGPVVNGYGW
jgi:hypothetical protein